MVSYNIYIVIKIVICCTSRMPLLVDLLQIIFMTNTIDLTFLLVVAELPIVLA